MCLAIPARIVRIKENDLADVAIAGVVKEICISLVPDVAVDDYVIIHVGFALCRLDQQRAQQTLALFTQLSETS
jgi:hydrogenase expression/formation protein HypC